MLCSLLIAELLYSNRRPPVTESRVLCLLWMHAMPAVSHARGASRQQEGMPRLGCSVYYDTLTGTGRHFIDTR